MKTKAVHIGKCSIRIFLMVFWLYAALDKLWELEAFHRSLLRQPFPDVWADVLYWSLPLAELGTAFLFVDAKKSVIANPTRGREKQSLFSPTLPYLVSATLMLVFTVYIALGVAGAYSELPCGCASVFSGMTWRSHLLVNILLLALSILGWWLSWLSRQNKGKDTVNRASTDCKKVPQLLPLGTFRFVLCLFFEFKRLFPRRFAPFPGRPVRSST